MNFQRRLPRATQLVAGVVTGFVLILSGAWADDFQGATHMVPLDEDTLHYSQSRATGPVARLQERIDQGTVKLNYDDTFGYLREILVETKQGLPEYWKARAK